MKRLHAFGVKRSGAYVTVGAEADRVVVQWREGGVRKAKSYPTGADGKRHAKAFAQGTHDRLSRGAVAAPERLTLADLFRRYTLAKAPAWRAKTATNERARWSYFVEHVGPNVAADLVSAETLDELADLLRKRKRPIAPNQVRAILANVGRVFRWAAKRRLLAENPLVHYSAPLGKDDRALDVPEFPPEETAAVVARFTPKDSRRWRAWVACVIAATQGARVNAILQLEDAAVDVGRRVVTWRAASDKLGRERVQPLTRDAVHAIRVARVWRRRLGYGGRYLIPAVRGARRAADLPWAYSALHRLIVEAEREAGVPHRPFRAMHGFRRMAGRNALEATGGDLNAAAEWIGDTDLRVFKRSYVKERGESLRRVADVVRMPTEGDRATTSERQP